jgi:hypothetical protein
MIRRSAAMVYDSYFLYGMLFFAAISVFFIVCYVVDTRRRDNIPLFTAEWKGLGGGLGGWRVSRPLAWALLALAFGIATAALIGEKMGLDHALATERAKYEFQLQSQRESEERKYKDAELARKTDLEKTKLTADAKSNTPAARQH